MRIKSEFFTLLKDYSPQIFQGLPWRTSEACGKEKEVASSPTSYADQS